MREPSGVEIRRAPPRAARAFGSVSAAAVAGGWAYLGELAAEPMFEPADWDRLVADHAPPNLLFVATDESGSVIGYSAVHPADGELFLLFVHPDYGRRGV